jgi:hypothetical integral membrane protein (TIGR02206 family)
MGTDFVVFGPAHFLIMAAVPAAGAMFAWFGRRSQTSARRLRLGLGLLLLVNELIWYGYRLGWERLRLADVVPLQLCDLALWLTILALITLKSGIYEVAYFTALAGSSMAVLTPDLNAPAWSYPTFYYFLAHGEVIASILFLTWARLLRPRPGCVWRTFIVLNLFAACVGVFNAVFQTNYIYLCRKPAGASLLDYMGPWPVYIGAGEVLALGLFTLLWLPFRRANQRPAAP